MNSTITEIDGLEFVKGTPLRLGPDTADKVVVVEFWATWCPPCRDSIPHVSKLAQQYKEQNVIVIGITNEQDGEKVKQFVNSQGSSMEYTVAIDRKGAANRAFMVPTNTKGIPAAFILERNKLIHNSHPMDPAFATVLQAAVARSAASPPKPLPLVTAGRDELMQKPNKELRQILKERGISDKDCLEKGDFVDKIIKTCSQVQYYASS
ncbi:hypothetical protein INT43_001735 [Umbelopsis isabellina]|uniref:Thioredoxin domain-containing protein n=1 Tax=Mortierella isabellina TaxID=91625 RepID=A0A8H7PR22_MORIS|nr:hypothetical protein INT43_001735 [Umbelopsis isabellina]